MSAATRNVLDQCVYKVLVGVSFPDKLLVPSIFRKVFKCMLLDFEDSVLSDGWPTYVPAVVLEPVRLRPCLANENTPFASE